MSRLRCAGAAIAALLAMAFPLGARAQTADATPAWSFQLTPYLWLPSIDSTFQYHLRDGTPATTDISRSPGDYLTKLNFAAAAAGEADYGRYAILTDFMYLNLNNGGGGTRSVDFGGGPASPFSHVKTVDSSTRMQSVLWSLAGAYTLIQGDWGNLDALGGLRLIYLKADTNYAATRQFDGPGGRIVNRGGTISGSQDVWNGIAGVRGRINLGESKFYIPYYLDLGAGDSNFTWQAMSGLGYQLSWGSISAGYRYESYQQGSSAFVKSISFGGPFLAATFKF